MHADLKTILVAGLLSVSGLCAGAGQAQEPAAAPQDPADMPSERLDYAASGWPAESLPRIAEALSGGEVSAAELVQTYLDRIARIDRANGDGPRLQAVLALNPDAMAAARAADARAAAGEPLGRLHGVPVLIKDNIETADPVATTAGALALKDNLTGRDSPLVAGLRADGAIILGKANLSQWANFRSERSISGWSALGGQVRNPHMLDRSPCGSSSGSGAGVAASLAAGAVGTETNGSITCPAQVNGVVGFKPTVGLVSQDHIVPISSSQDTAGPMTKTVRGAAMMLSAMTGQSNATDFEAGLDAGSLEGARLGVMRFSVGNNPDIQARFATALETLEAAGAELVEIEQFEPNAENFWAKARSVLEYEFKATLNAYLDSSPADLPVRSLDELIAFNKANPERELALFDQSLFEAAAARGDLSSEAYVEARAAVQSATRENGIDALMREHDLDALVSPSGPVASRIDPVNGDVWPDWSGAGWMAAIAGYPHLSVPMGTVHGVPVGLSFMGPAGADGAILSFGYAYEQASGRRAEPAYLPTAMARDEIAQAMNRP